MIGSDASLDDEVVHEFNLVIADDPSRRGSDSDDHGDDVVKMLER
jgi:hypothetical protein